MLRRHHGFVVVVLPGPNLSVEPVFVQRSGTLPIKKFRSGCTSLSRFQPGQEREVPGKSFQVRVGRSIFEDSEHQLKLLAVIIIIVILLVEHELDA